MIKRAGLDYWPKLDVKEHDDYEAFLSYVAEEEKLKEQTEGVSRHFQCSYYR